METDMAKKQRNRIRVGVVGLGRIGWSHHAKTLKDHPDFQVVACVDPIEERRKEAEAELGCATFADLNSFLKSGLAEAAIVCTMSVDHCPHTVACLKAGLHVVVEKPMAMNVREVDKMIAAAEKAGKVLTVHQSARAGESLRFIRETMDSGLLGEVVFMRNSSHSFTRRNDWQMLKKNGGGYLNNNGSHAVDTALQLLDAPVRDVWGELKHTVTGGDADDFVKACIRGENGRVIEVEQSYVCAFPQPEWLVCGTCGTMQIVRREAQIKFFNPKKVKPIGVVDGAAVGRRYGNEDKLPWQEKTVPAKPKKPYPDFYARFAATIREGKPLLVTPASVRVQIGVLDAIRKSARWKA